MKKTFLLLMGLSVLANFSENKAFAQTGQADPSNGNNIIESAIDDAIMNDKNVETPAAQPKDLSKKTVQKQTVRSKEDTQVDPSNEYKPLVEAKKEVKKNIKSPSLEKEEVVKIRLVTKQVKSRKNGKISKEESEYLASLDKKSEDKKEIDPASKYRAYDPAPSESQETKHEGFVIERDSSKIIKKRMSYSDSLTVKMCEVSGLSVVLDDDIQTELQTALIDDKVFFNAQVFENHRGAFVVMTQPMPEGKQRESALRLVRKDNDKAYLINLIGVPCPKSGTSPYPKEIYIRDKSAGISGKSSKIMTPEDTIIELSDGLPRRNVNVVSVYDMIARSTSDWTVFGIQVKLPAGQSFRPEDFTIKMIDNLQVAQLPTKVDLLPIQSEKASKSLGVETARYKVIVNIDKQYMVENRYLYLMLVDKKGGYYQYMRIDTLPRINELRKRGFDI